MTAANTAIPEAIRSMQESLAAMPVAKALPKSGAIDDRPLVGAEINIRLALSPGMITLISAPITVLFTMLVGWFILKTLGLPIYGSEMLGGAIVSTIGGVFASIPLFVLMKRGAAAIAQAGILGIAVRCGAILTGMVLAGMPAWGLSRMPLVWWVMGYYFPMLVVETAVVAWLSNKARH
jgi:hypothetical protein